VDIDPELERLLAPTATTAERVKGLVKMGIPLTTISETTRSSLSTLRNWIAGNTQPRQEAAFILDDFRMIASALLEGLEAKRAAQWLSSRDPNRFDGIRPVEMIAIDPMDVLAAAGDAVLAVHATERPPAGADRRRRLPRHLAHPAPLAPRSEHCDEFGTSSGFSSDDRR
jgi:hypothetical protein